MNPQVTIRRANPSEHALVRKIVQTVVDETYGGIWAKPPLVIDEEDWSRASVAVGNHELLGMMLTEQDWVSDLWVLRPFRNIGVGGLLLEQAETEIAGRQHLTGRLRVVSFNTRAQTFYKRHGWTVRREFPHEKLPISMIEMAKTLRVSP
ncbi:MAG: GNAT family N-acetyltransferase [Rhizobiales bacterium]|nr:GNAT family N-acetyltransferase [Hyphomicrobiales bacterium]